MTRVLISILFFLSISSLQAQTGFLNTMQHGYALNATVDNCDDLQLFSDQLDLAAYRSFNHYLVDSDACILSLNEHQDFKSELRTNPALNLIVGYSLRFSNKLVGIDFVEKAYHLFQEQNDTFGIVFSLRTMSSLQKNYNYDYDEKYLYSDPILNPFPEIISLTQNSKDKLYQIINLEFALLKYRHGDQIFDFNEINGKLDYALQSLKQYPELACLKQSLYRSLGIYHHKNVNYQKDLEAAIARLQYCHDNIRTGCLMHILNAANNAGDHKTMDEFIEKINITEGNSDYVYLEVYYFYLATILEREGKHEEAFNNMDEAYRRLANFVEHKMEDSKKYLQNNLILREVAVSEKLKRDKFKTLVLLTLAIFILSILLLIGYIQIKSIKRRNELLRLKQNITAVLTHDLRAPLLSVLATLEMEKDQLGLLPLNTTASSEIRKLLTGMNDFISEVIEFMKNNSKRESQVEEVVDFEDLIKIFIHKNQQYYNLARVRVNYIQQSSLLRLSSKNIISINVILRNLISNLIEHNHSKEIGISYIADNNKFNIYLEAIDTTFNTDELEFLNSVFSKEHSIVSGYGIILIKNFMSYLENSTIVFSNKNGSAFIEFSMKHKI